MSLSICILLSKGNCQCSPQGQHILLILSYSSVQYWVRGAMKLQGEQLEHVAKNRKHLPAAKGEVVAHVATCLQTVQLGCAFGSAGSEQALLSAFLVLPWPAFCSMVDSSWRRSLEVGTYEKVQICMGEGKSEVFNFSQLQRTWSNLAQMKRSFFTP